MARSPSAPSPSPLSDSPILAIDVGAGTQDVLLYDPAREPENSLKLVLPSQTQIVGARVREATAAGLPIHLHGVLMGGGASTDAMKDHLAAGLLSPQRMPLARSTMTWTACEALAWRSVPMLRPARRSSRRRTSILAPGGGACAVWDRTTPAGRRRRPRPWFRPGSGNNEVRFEYLQGLLAGGATCAMVYTESPAGMTRMDAVRRSTPGVYLMDTGAAAVLGALGDPVVAEAASSDGAILVNVGNMHTFATLLKGRRLFRLFEHHTGGITSEIIAALVARLRDAPGHGALPRDLRWARRGPRPHTGRPVHSRSWRSPVRPAARAWSWLSRGGATAT